MQTASFISLVSSVFDLQIVNAWKSAPAHAAPIRVQPTVYYILLSYRFLFSPGEEFEQHEVAVVLHQDSALHHGQFLNMTEQFIYGTF